MPQASLQQEADEALDIADMATLELQQKKTLLERERDELKAALASQAAAASDSTKRNEILEKELEDATRQAAQVGSHASQWLNVSMATSEGQASLRECCCNSGSLVGSRSRS